MNYVYLLKSMSNGRIYIGFSVDLKRRLVEHNSGGNKSTKGGMPWKLIYYEAYFSRKDAIIREKLLKQDGRSRVWLKKRLKSSLV